MMTERLRIMAVVDPTPSDQWPLRYALASCDRHSIGTVQRLAGGVDALRFLKCLSGIRIFETVQHQQPLHE